MVVYKCCKCEFSCELKTGKVLDRRAKEKLNRCPIFKPIYGEEIKAEWIEQNWVHKTTQKHFYKHN